MTRKSIFMTIIAFFMIGILSLDNYSHAGDSKALIEKVKGVIFASIDKNITIGKALDTYKYFKKTNWRAFEDSKGRKYVEFVGNVDYDPEKLINTVSDEILKIEKIDVVAQFIVNNDDTVDAKFLGTEIQTKGGKTESDPWQEPAEVLKLIYEDQDIAYALGVHAVLLYRATRPRR